MKIVKNENDVSFLSEQNAMQSIYNDLRDIEKRNAFAKLFENIKGKFNKNKFDVDSINLGR